MVHVFLFAQMHISFHSYCASMPANDGMGIGSNSCGDWSFSTIPWESCNFINDEACHGTDNESFLNPGQTAVLGADHALYAIAKQLQWGYPNLLGEDKMVFP